MGDEHIRILLVEDNQADVYLFRMALERENLEVDLTVLSDGAEALAFARNEGRYAGAPAPHLAVMDLNLPKTDGVEVLSALRQNECFSRVPVVVTSSSSSPVDRSKVEALGVARFVPKPLDLEEFLQIGTILKQVLIENHGVRTEWR